MSVFVFFMEVLIRVALNESQLFPWIPSAVFLRMRRNSPRPQLQERGPKKHFAFGMLQSDSVTCGILHARSFVAPGVFRNL